MTDRRQHQREDANLRLLRGAFEALQDHDVDRCVAMLTPDFVINIAGMPTPKRGASAWRRHAEILLAAVPDVRLDIEHTVESGDELAVRVRVSGTHRGEFMGFRGTGNAIDYLSHETYRFEGGRIAEEWICSDTLTMFNQVGGISTARLGAMYLSGHRFWFGALAGAAAGALSVGLWREIAT